LDVFIEISAYLQENYRGLKQEFVHGDKHCLLMPAVSPVMIDELPMPVMNQHTNFNKIWQCTTQQILHFHLQ